MACGIDCVSRRTRHRVDRALDIAQDEAEQVVGFREVVVERDGPAQRLDRGGRGSGAVAGEPELVLPHRVLRVELHALLVGGRRLRVLAPAAVEIAEQLVGLRRPVGQARGLRPVTDGLLVPFLRPVGLTAADAGGDRFRPEAESGAVLFDGGERATRGQRTVAGRQIRAVVPIAIDDLNDDGEQRDDRGKQSKERDEGGAGSNAPYYPTKPAPGRTRLRAMNSRRRGNGFPAAVS